MSMFARAVHPKEWAHCKSPAEARFLAKVDVDIITDCWVWQGAINPVTGYGDCQVDLHHTTAHRIAWMLFRGAIPEGMHIDHLCRNRRCVRPGHLEPVSQAENNRRAAMARNAVTA